MFETGQQKVSPMLSALVLAGMYAPPPVIVPQRVTISSFRDGHKPPHNKAALKAAKQHKAAMRRAGKR